MKFFLDTADLAEIEEAASWGALAGVTTNPTLYSRIGGKLDDFHDHIKRICELVDGPVSAESVAMTRDEIIADGRKLASIADNVVVKIPTMVEGLAATKVLASEGIAVNMTLCFSVPQAILAARSMTISETATCFSQGISNVEEMTSPRIERSISVTSSGRSSTSKHIK